MSAVHITLWPIGPVLVSVVCALWLSEEMAFAKARA